MENGTGLFFVEHVFVQTFHHLLHRQARAGKVDPDMMFGVECTAVADKNTAPSHIIQHFVHFLGDPQRIGVRAKAVYGSLLHTGRHKNSGEKNKRFRNGTAAPEIDVFPTAYGLPPRSRKNAAVQEEHGGAFSDFHKKNAQGDAAARNTHKRRLPCKKNSACFPCRRYSVSRIERSISRAARISAVC